MSKQMDRLFNRAEAILDGKAHGFGMPILRILAHRRYGPAMLSLAARETDTRQLFRRTMVEGHGWLIANEGRPCTARLPNRVHQGSCMLVFDTTRIPLPTVKEGSNP